MGKRDDTLSGKLRAGRVLASRGASYTFGPTNSPSANNAIAVLETLPLGKNRAGLIAAQKKVAEASDEQLARWDAILADPQLSLVKELGLHVANESLGRMLSNQIEERRRKTEVKIEGRRHWGGILLTAIITAIVTLVLAKIFNVGA